MASLAGERAVIYGDQARLNAAETIGQLEPKSAFSTSSSISGKLSAFSLDIHTTSQRKVLSLIAGNILKAGAIDEVESGWAIEARSIVFIVPIATNTHLDASVCSVIQPKSILAS